MSSAGALALRARPSFGRLGRWLLGCLAIVAVLGAAYLFWLRDLPVFAVDRVKVEGLSAGSPGAAEVEAALVDAAKDMTTLHVRLEELESVAGRFPLVASVSAASDFPDGLTITVTERRPAALIGEGEDAVAVAADGTLMPGVATDRLDLPALPLRRAPTGERLGGPVLDQVRVLGAAPEALRPLIAGSTRRGDGVVVELEAGIELRFGAPVRLAEKWRAGAAVLSDPGLTAVDYVDLTAPGRPAAGGSGHLLPPVP
jgi:cell division protein FtsQ